MHRHSPQRSLFVAAILAGLGPALTFATASAQPVSGLARRGEAIVTRDCAICHAAGRKEPALADLLRRVSPDILRRELATGITAGHPQMPRSRYDTGDIEAIMAYLQDLSGQ